MRLRVLAPLVGLVLLMVLAVTVPALAAVARDRSQELVLDRSAALGRFAALARAADDSGDATALEQHVQRYTALYGEPVLVIDSAGGLVAGTPGLDLDDAAVRELVGHTLRNQPNDTVPVLRPWSGRWHLMSQAVVGSADFTGGAVLLRVDAGRAIGDIRLRWSLAILIAVVGGGLLTGLALGMTRWILRPVRELDEAAHALAEGREPARLRRSGPPELRRLSSSFDDMAQAVTATISERGRLVHDFSHRLRNPLAALRLRLDSRLAGGHRDGSLEQMDGDLGRLEELVDTMLDLAEAEHRAASGSVRGLLGPDDRPLETTAEFFAEEVVARWSGLAAERGSTLLRTGVDHVTLCCTATEAHDMVDALVENALKYAGAGSTVVLGVAPSGPDRAAITVTDSGPGLDEAGLTRATDRFWRGPSATGTTGTGIGLSIVERLVTANGGTLCLESPAGGGLVARLELPAVPS